MTLRALIGVGLLCLLPLAVQAQADELVVEKIVAGLDALTPSLPGELTLVMGNFTFEDSGLASPFSRWLEDQFSTALTQTKVLKLFPRNLLQNLPEDLQESYRVQLGAGKAGGMVFGRFFFEPSGSVSVEYRVVEFLTNTELGRRQFAVTKAQVPVRFKVAPLAPSAVAALAETPAPSGTLGLSASTDRGQGGAYFAGEILKLNVSVSADCYLKIYLLDALGTVTLLFPNKYRPDPRVAAGSLIKIPDVGYPFVLTLGPPFGRETLYFFASPQPFPKTEKAFEPLGKDLMFLVTQGVGYLGQDIAQASVTYTVNKKE